MSLAVGGWGTGWMDPRTGQLWPSVDPSTGAVAGSGVVSARVVEAIPAVGRAMGVIAGRISQMPLTLWEGPRQVEPTPALLRRPDPSLDYATLIGAVCWDYWIHGNAILYETVHDEDTGLPLAAVWLPAEQVGCWRDPSTGAVEYAVGSMSLVREHVRHFRRRLDPRQPWRGVGVLEQHMRAFAKVSDQQAYESSLLRESGVPSVAIVVGNPDLSQEEAEKAKNNWMGKFAGPRREPAFLPAGTVVNPLSWSPTDSQMVESQQASRGDIADIFDLDRYYIGVTDGSFNYKTAASMSLALVKDTLGEHVRTFEDVLTAAWCLPGREIRMDTSQVIVDDMAAETAWLVPAVNAGVVTIDEARSRLGYAPMTDEQRAQSLEQRITRPSTTTSTEGEPK